MSNANATIEDMHRAEERMNALLAGAKRGGLRLSTPPIDTHLQARKAHALAEIREVLERYELDVDWEALARHAEDARREHNLTERHDADCSIEIDADDIEQRCAGRIPLAEI